LLPLSRPIKAALSLRTSKIAPDALGAGLQTATESPTVRSPAVIALGAGLQTATESPTVRSPAVIAGLGRK
jgi:hypothetical protein